MTNKPNDVRVSRELLERVCLGDASKRATVSQLVNAWAAMGEIRTLLAQPADQQGDPVAERYPIVGKFYTWRGHGRCEYIGPTRDIGGWLPNFRFQNGKDRAMNPEQFLFHLEEFAQPATAKVDERAEFEAWHRARYPLHLMLLDFDEARGEYAYPSRREMFDVWQARAKLSGGQS